MPRLGDTPVNDKLVDTQFSYNDIIPIYDVSEAKNKFTTFHELLHAYGYEGTAVLDALRAYRAKYPTPRSGPDGSGNFTGAGPPNISTKVPMHDQYFIQTDGTETENILNRDSGCWAARFDLTGVAFHDSNGFDSSRRGTLIGPRAVVLATHHAGGVGRRLTFTNAKGERFKYRFAQSGGSFSTSGGYSSLIDLHDIFGLGDQFEDLSIAILEADDGGTITSVDESLTQYSIKKFTGASGGLSPKQDPPAQFTYLLDTRTRSSHFNQDPFKQRVTWRILGTMQSLFSTGNNLHTTGVTSQQASSGQISYDDWFNGAGIKDSSDPVFFVDDDNTLNLIGCYKSVNKIPIIGTPSYPYVDGSFNYNATPTYPALDAIDTYLAAWNTTRKTP